MPSSGTATFLGAFRIRVTDASLERCRHRAIDELDALLAAWIVNPPVGKRPRLARPVLKEPGRINPREETTRRITKRR
jgi:hypothetical protein